MRHYLSPMVPHPTDGSELDRPAALERLSRLLGDKRLAVLAGAGMSTASGIPDYGGLHSTTRKTRIQYATFVGDMMGRRRYWARAAVGWSRVSGARPNAAHQAVARLESNGFLSGVITQNVDGLHHRAGNRRVVELHGSLARVVCLVCGARSSRDEMQRRLLDANPWLATATAARAPDGDSELSDDQIESLELPQCLECGGTLKPDVVFFGETVPRAAVTKAWQAYEAAEVLLVAGSSLAVFSGYRFVLRAAREGKPVVIVNRGPTRGDDAASLKVDGDLTTVLPDLASSLARKSGDFPS